MKKLLLPLLMLVGLVPTPTFSHDGTLDAYGNGGSTTTPGQRIRRARGHDRDKERVLSGDVINGIYGRGFNGTAFTTSDSASIEIQAGENWSTTANGSKVVIKTTPLTSVTAATSVSINGTGLIVTMPSAQTIAEGDVITADACGTVKRITAAGAVTTNTTNTFTAPAASNAGCVMYLVNVGAQNITLDTNSNFVSAGAANVVVTANDALIVASDGTDWYQISALLAN